MQCYRPANVGSFWAKMCKIDNFFYITMTEVSALSMLVKFFSISKSNLAFGIALINVHILDNYCVIRLFTPSFTIKLYWEYLVYRIHLLGLSFPCVIICLLWCASLGIYLFFIFLTKDRFYTCKHTHTHLLISGFDIFFLNLNFKEIKLHIF